jgi:hypothetical protein
MGTMSTGLPGSGLLGFSWFNAPAAALAAHAWNSIGGAQRVELTAPLPFANNYEFVIDMVNATCYGFFLDHRECEPI